MLLPESRVDSILEQLDVTPPGADGMTGCRNLDVMFSSSLNIEENLRRVLANYGYQCDEPGENYVDIGVNWAYTGAQLSMKLDAPTLLALAGALGLILLTGYLIIYNVFQISVAGDIRFYGLLKAIGTTPRWRRCATPRAAPRNPARGGGPRRCRCPPWRWPISAAAGARLP